MYRYYSLADLIPSMPEYPQEVYGQTIELDLTYRYIRLLPYPTPELSIAIPDQSTASYLLS